MVVKWVDCLAVGEASMSSTRQKAYGGQMDKLLGCWGSIYE